jgi:hypothetical protein
MSDETQPVSEADCVPCRDLDPGQRAATRADLLEIPLHEPVCGRCVEAFWINLCASFPKTEEERLRGEQSVRAND